MGGRGPSPCDTVKLRGPPKASDAKPASENGGVGRGERPRVRQTILKIQQWDNPQPSPKGVYPLLRMLFTGLDGSGHTAGRRSARA